MGARVHVTCAPAPPRPPPVGHHTCRWCEKCAPDGVPTWVFAGRRKRPPARGALLELLGSTRLFMRGPSPPPRRPKDGLGARAGLASRDHEARWGALLYNSLAAPDGHTLGKWRGEHESTCEAPVARTIRESRFSGKQRHKTVEHYPSHNRRPGIICPRYRRGRGPQAAPRPVWYASLGAPGSATCGRPGTRLLSDCPPFGGNEIPVA